MKHKSYRYKREKFHRNGRLFKTYKCLEYLLIFVTGALAYYWIEVSFRGHSHWTMALLGGISLILVGLLNEGVYPKHIGIIPQMVCGGILITALELIWGLVLNVWLGMGIWDYSNLPFNFMGQICPQFTLAWIGLSLVAILLDDFLRHAFFKEPYPKYHAFFCKCSD